MAQNPLKMGKDPSLYHIPPQSLEAEESILSAILVDNNVLLDVIEILSPDDFYRSAHQKIFAAITELFDKGEPIDLVTLANKLNENGCMEEIGGASYLAKLVDAVPLAVNALHYGKIIHDKAALRRLIEKANAIAKRCFEDRGDVDEIIDYAESSIFEISERKTRQEGVGQESTRQEGVDQESTRQEGVDQEEDSEGFSNGRRRVECRFRDGSRRTQ